LDLRHYRTGGKNAFAFNVILKEREAYLYEAQLAMELGKKSVNTRTYAGFAEEYLQNVRLHLAQKNI